MRTRTEDIEIKTLSGVIEIPKSRYEASRGDVGVVYVDGVEHKHVLIADVMEGYIVKAVQPITVSSDGKDILKETINGEVRVVVPPRSR